jgi:cyclopropane-fatty-acyl-phospholipid synthase
MRVIALVEDLLGTDLPVRVVAYDGSSTGPSDAHTTVVIRSPDALRRIFGAPGELGFARAYIAGDLDLEGSIFGVLELRDRLTNPRVGPRQLAGIVRLLGCDLRPPSPPETEYVPRGRRHSRKRDRASVSYHYDVGNEFYATFLGPTLTYSCAVFENDSQSLDQGQTNKYELVCRKLGLEPGMRLLDVGCGWGGMALHAARQYGVDVVGVTVSRRQAELARQRVSEASLDHLVDIRLQDYRDVTGDFDAISSIGMFEHVGMRRVKEYFGHLRGLTRDGGRLLNHAINQPQSGKTRMPRRGLMNRYVFPDGELHEVGTVVTAIADAGFEPRHVESLREHYARTLRHWVMNLESNWSEAVEVAGPMRARAWRLYMGASSINFEANRLNIHQVMATATADGRSRMSWRPTWERETLRLESDVVDLTDQAATGSAETPARSSDDVRKSATEGVHT